MFSSVQSLSGVKLFAIPWTTARQASLSITNSWSLLKLMSIKPMCHPTISSSIIPFSSFLQSSPASGSFQMSQFFASGGQSTGAWVLPMSIQDWFPLGFTCLIPLQSKGLSRVFSNTTVQKHQFFGAQLSLWSNSHIHTRLLTNAFSIAVATPSNFWGLHHAILNICFSTLTWPGFDPWVGKTPWRMNWQSTPVFLSGELHGQRSLVSYSLWGRKESDTTEQKTLSLSTPNACFHFVPVFPLFCWVMWEEGCWAF